jgi:hypothetical protein
VVVEKTKKNLCVRVFFDGKKNFDEKKSLSLSSYSGGGGEDETKALTQEHQYEYALILVYICPHTRILRWRRRKKSSDARRRASEYEDRYIV